MITETKAAKKFCPFMRGQHQYSFESQPQWAHPRINCCAASDCMMWRWGNKDKTLGFCGLAGQYADGEIT